MGAAEVHGSFIISRLAFLMQNTSQTYWTNQIESVVRSTVAARSLKGFQARILAYRIAQLVRDELAMMREDALE